MQGPALLSKELSHYLSCQYDQELFEALSKKPADVIDFFEVACADETWAQEHVILLRKIVRWGAKSYYLSQLPTYSAARMAETIQQHYSLLEPFLYFRPAYCLTMTLEVEKQKILVNSLLFGAASPYFFNLFKISCYDRMTDQWVFPISLRLFRLVEQFVNHGEISDLWRSEDEELYNLMRLAKTWELPRLVKQCADVLRRYINRDNVVETLLRAHREFFSEWKDECIEYFNAQEWGIRLLPGREGDFKVEILDFREDTLELFARLAPVITHLAFRSQPVNRDLIYRCPKLVGLDFSGSSQYADQFNDMPENIFELDLSACPWLTPQYLQKVAKQFPFLKELNLSSNTQLNYLAWGELPRFRHLITLYLARCHQINDEDLKLICQSSTHLTHLDLEECRGFTDRGVLDIVQYCPRLAILNISRCYTLTDKSLQELGARANSLTNLSVVRCTTLTDRGLLQYLQLHPTLHTLDVKQCEFSFETLRLIRRQYPVLKLIE